MSQAEIQFRDMEIDSDAEREASERSLCKAMLLVGKRISSFNRYLRRSRDSQICIRNGDALLLDTSIKSDAIKREKRALLLQSLERVFEAYDTYEKRQNDLASGIYQDMRIATIDELFVTHSRIHDAKRLSKYVSVLTQIGIVKDNEEIRFVDYHIQTIVENLRAFYDFHKSIHDSSVAPAALIEEEGIIAKVRGLLRGVWRG